MLYIISINISSTIIEKFFSIFFNFGLVLSASAQFPLSFGRLLTIFQVIIVYQCLIACNYLFHEGRIIFASKMSNRLPMVSSNESQIFKTNLAATRTMAVTRLMFKISTTMYWAITYARLSSQVNFLRLIKRFSSTISLTFSTFSSVFVVDGHPERGKSSIIVRPLLKSLYHTHTPVSVKPDSSKTFCNIFHDSAQEISFPT